MFYGVRMQSRRRSLAAASDCLKNVVEVIKRAQLSCGDARWASTNISSLSSIPDPSAPSSTAPNILDGEDDELGSPATIADGWFNPNPVKSTPDCPSSMQSMFVGRIIPAGMSLSGEAPEPKLPKIEDQGGIGVGRFLLNAKGQQEAWGQPGLESGQEKMAQSSKRDLQETLEEHNFEATPGLVTEKCSHELSSEDLNKYYPFDRKKLPEAFAGFYKTEVPDDVRAPVPKGGSKTLAKEFATSRRDKILARECILELMGKLSDDNFRKGQRLLLHGRPGSGKSLALAAIAEWARNKNWLVMYIPSALVFGNDLFFHSRPGSTMYDTPNIAKDILRSVMESHKGILKDMEQGLDMGAYEVADSHLGTNLLDLCEIGLAAQQPAVAVDAAVKLLHEMMYVERQVPALLLIDDYNGLYWKTTYGRYVSEKKREMITIDQTKLGAAMRLLEKHNDEKLKGCVLAAPTFSQGIRPDLWVPLGEGVVKEELDLLSVDEVKRMLCYYWNCNFISPISGVDLTKVFFMCGGNGHDLQRTLAVL